MPTKKHIREVVQILDPVTRRYGHWVTVKHDGAYMHIFIFSDDKGRKKKRVHAQHDSNNPYTTYTKSELRQAIGDMDRLIKSEEKELRQSMKQPKTPKLTDDIKRVGGIRAPKKGQAFYTEWKDFVPPGMKRQISRSNGRPLDEVADELGMTAVHLIGEIQNANKKSKLDKDFAEFYDLHKQRDQVKELKKEMEKMKKALKAA